MSENRVVQGRMVTAQTLAELIEDDSVMEAEQISEAETDCPECSGNVLEVGYMPSVTEFVTGQKCQDCDWAATDRN
ncbi:hypothetical protein C483_03725 [Natrialba hulunbeirensis JCM 10989]|uniref:Small CPxCG-related zinc finger protein n=1 Tax=Natrialba hulunbeirensis JCM 10989 TaxID=1227493 RepID=M0AA84_9EURY|nr:DUF5795 family protein [Natrialba hulunbeirensis]ELY94243.1 hypothetical protein C483_03725 [Natrialba hulunbeirensis JCM 10989]